MKLYKHACVAAHSCGHSRYASVVYTMSSQYRSVDMVYVHDVHACCCSCCVQSAPNLSSQILQSNVCLGSARRNELRVRHDLTSSSAHLQQCQSLVMQELGLVMPGQSGDAYFGPGTTVVWPWHVTDFSKREIYTKLSRTKSVWQRADLGNKGILLCAVTVC